MKILTSIPPQLRGRGHPNCVPVSCDCGETFLWEHAQGVRVRCPTCRKFEWLEDADENNEPVPLEGFVAHNGQAR